MTPPHAPSTTITAETLDCLMACWEVLQDNAMNCVLTFDGAVDDARLHHAIRLTLDAEPILGCRFTERWYRPVWRRRDDLDELKLCRIVQQDPEQTGLRRFLAETFDAERDCQVRTELWRGATDVLGIKLSHKVGDGQALKQYVYLLADTYKRLADDPAYRPRPNPSTDRSLRQLLPRLARARQQPRRHPLRKPPLALRKNGLWKRPSGNGGPRQPAVHIRRLDAGRYAAVFDYAFRRRATVFHVLLGAMFLAARETMPHTDDTRLPIGSVVDLRAYADDQQALPLCNLFGVLPIVIEAGQADTLDQVIGQVREQFLATRDGHRQLAVPPFDLDAHPVVSRVWRCVPYQWIKASSQLWLKWRESAFLLLSDIGSLDPDHLDFGGPEVSEAFVASGMIHDPALSLLCVSSFRNTLTICTGAAHAFPVEQLLDRTLAALPRENTCDETVQDAAHLS